MLCRSLGSRKQVRVDIFAQKSRRSDSTGNSYAKAKVNFRGTCSCDSVVFTMLRTLILASLSVVLLLPLRSLAAKETKLYDALGVPPDSDENVIKKAYRKAAL